MQFSFVYEGAESWIFYSKGSFMLKFVIVAISAPSPSAEI